MQTNFPIEEYGQAYRFVLDYKKQDPFTSNDDFAKMLLNFVKSFAASLPQSSTEEEKELWEEVVKEVEITKYEDVIHNLQSQFKISKR